MVVEDDRYTSEFRIDLTPLDVRYKEFRLGLRGFQVNEVRDYLDQVSKHWVIEGLNLRQAGEMDVAPFLKFRMAWNTGVNFGLLANNGELARTVLITGQSILALALLIGALWSRRVIHIAGLGIAAGGAMGNILDRWTWGAVADFLNLSCCGIDNPWSFNIADIAVFAGLALLLWPVRRRSDEQPMD